MLPRTPNSLCKRTDNRALIMHACWYNIFRALAHKISTETTTFRVSRHASCASIWAWVPLPAPEGDWLGNSAAARPGTLLERHIVLAAAEGRWACGGYGRRAIAGRWCRWGAERCLGVGAPAVECQCAEGVGAIVWCSNLLEFTFSRVRTQNLKVWLGEA